MAWMTVVIVNLLFIACTVFAYERSGLLGKAGEVGAMIAEKIPEDQDPTAKDRQIWMYVAIAASVATGLLLLLTLVMIKRIRIAVAVIKVSSQAVSTMPSILLFPVAPFILEVFIVLYFVFVSALLYSAGDLVPKYKTSSTTLNLNSLLGTGGTVPQFGGDSATPASATVPVNITREECALDGNCYYGVEWDNTLKYMFLYHLFGILWANQFIVGFGYTVIAGAIANFYWSRGDSKTMAGSPVLTSMKRTVIYHLGSIALGSFIVAVIQFVRILLEYIDRKTKKLQEKSHAAIKYIMQCVKCFLWCLEKIMKFINRNAYIMVSVKGTNFCVSAGRAVALLVQNALRLAAVNVMGDILIWLGKLAITAGAGCVAFLMADLEYYTNEDKYPDTFLSSPLMPILISLLVGYVVADLFFEVYEMAIDTILLSFCEDCETSNGNPKYAPPLLLEAIGKAQKSKEKKETKG
ncbi:hypothetical protein BSKO_09968 [Bryopsis sp. KO-2023]|nr:hypothetical protein BSKO_09968 [Bryopsis sp. KO-2023]